MCLWLCVHSDWQKEVLALLLDQLYVMVIQNYMCTWDCVFTVTCSQRSWMSRRNDCVLHLQSDCVHACDCVFTVTCTNRVWLSRRSSFITIVVVLGVYMCLCVHSDQHKEVLASYEGDVLQLLVKVLTSHPTSAHIQSEAISTVACLADIGKFFHSSQEDFCCMPLEIVKPLYDMNEFNSCCSSTHMCDVR